MNRAGRSRKRRDQDEAGSVGGVGISICRIYLLHLRIAAVGDIVGNGFAERWIDGADLGRNFVQI